MRDWKKIKKGENGITLIALIITIIILVILAAVSIRAVYEMGIVGYAINGTQQYAERAKEENAMLDETGRRIEDAVSKVKEIQGGNGSGTTTPTNPSNPSEPETPVGQKGPTGKPLVNSETVSDYITGTEPLVGEDRYGNPITIPAGFKVASDSGEDVTQGIVIEDNDVQTDGKGNQRGNQYVWIPTGTIHTDTAMTAANDKTIIAGRYEFADGSSNYTNEANETTTTAPARGTPILKQSLSNYATQPTNITYSTNSSDYHKIASATNSQIVVKGWFYEVADYRAGVASKRTDGLNRTASNLSSFATSVANNHGYYIARYEASWGTGNKVKSRVSTGTPPTSAPSSRIDGQLWNWVTEIDAAGYCQNIYNGINSDLMNSYAWDTAIVFIQTFSGDEDYSYQNSRNTGSNPSNTGVNNDEVCKINDMASNDLEWTTEFSERQDTIGAAPCVQRGGYCNGSNFYAAIRGALGAKTGGTGNVFRPTLYL